MTLDPEIVRIDIPATHKHLSIVSACITEILRYVVNITDREMVTYAIQLATHEACTNIIDHAYGNNPAERIALIITILLQPQQLLVDLYDTGKSFDPASIPPPDLSQAHAHGYGLFLIRSLMDSVTYNPEPGNNHWHLAKYLYNQ